MWGLRRQVSLLLSAGHPDAAFYPVHRVWEEARLVVQRENGKEVTHALLLQLAVSSAMNGKKSAQTAFQNIIEELTDGEG